MEQGCVRCGEERSADERWCRARGLDFTPTAASLPTPEALVAGERERRFFEAHPELLAAQEAREEEDARERERQEVARLSKVKPAGSDTLTRDRASARWGLIGSISSLLAALLAFLLVSRITRRQRERRAALEELPAASAAPFSGSQPTAATAPSS